MARTHTKRPKRKTDAEILAVLVVTGNNRGQAAARLGLTHDELTLRLEAMPADKVPPPARNTYKDE